MPSPSSPILLDPCPSGHLALQENSTVTDATVDTAECVGIFQAGRAGSGSDSTPESRAEPGIQSRRPDEDEGCTATAAVQTARDGSQLCGNERWRDLSRDDAQAGRQARL